MDDQKQKLIERIRQAQNVLVTVSANPSVDQLAAAIGLTLALNKLEKHGTAVFSGEVPSTIEFLKPQDTLEKDTNSLRDFIIALDKSKADKLRYKVEDSVVRIFITPYKTSLSEADLNFSQGDFNVDVVIALGVTEQSDLDTAITAHGRILHDATVVSVLTGGQSEIGTINWVDAQASSLSEMTTNLINDLDKKALDNQIATALLTGIVASTERFSNEKTSPKTMSVSATLMAAGANQQLIATELATPAAPVPEPVQINDITPPQESPKREPGTLEIDHETFTPLAPDAPSADPKPEPAHPQVHVDDDGNLHLAEHEHDLPKISQVRAGGTDNSPTLAEKSETEVKRELLTEPPRMGDNEITANTTPEDEYEPSPEELTLPPVQGPLLSHTGSVLTDVPKPGDLLGMPPVAPPLPPAPAAPSAPGADVFKPAFEPAPASWLPPTEPKPAEPATPAPLASALPPLPPTPAPEPAVASALPPLPPMPAPEPPAIAPAPSAAPAPVVPPIPEPSMPPAPAPAAGATLSQLEASVDSPHVHISEDGTFSNGLAPAAPSAPATGNVDDARDAVAAAFSNPGAPTPPPQAIAGLNAQPLGPDLHPAAPTPDTPITPVALAPALVVTNTGFSEPTPGNTPADSTLDMPLPSNPFGPGQQAASPPSAFPGAPTAASAGPPPPPVPPPMVPPAV